MYQVFSCLYNNQTFTPILKKNFIYFNKVLETFNDNCKFHVNKSLVNLQKKVKNNYDNFEKSSFPI